MVIMLGIIDPLVIPSEYFGQYLAYISVIDDLGNFILRSLSQFPYWRTPSFNQINNIKIEEDETLPKIFLNIL